MMVGATAPSVMTADFTFAGFRQIQDDGCIDQRNRLGTS